MKGECCRKQAPKNAETLDTADFSIYNEAVEFNIPER